MSSRLYDSIGQFTTVPNSVVKLIPQIGAHAFGLWTYLRFRTNNETGNAFPSYETIRRDLGAEYHSRKVAECIRVLMQFDLLERQRRYGQSSIYTVRAPTPGDLAGETSVLSTGKGQSFQRVKTNYIEINKNNNNNNNAPAAPVESPLPPPTPQPAPALPNPAWFSELERVIMVFDAQSMLDLAEAWQKFPDERRHNEAMRQLQNARMRTARVYLKAFLNFNPDWKPPTDSKTKEFSKKPIPRGGGGNAAPAQIHARAAPPKTSAQRLAEWKAARIAAGMDTGDVT